MTDRFTVRLVVGFLGILAIATVAGGFFLTAISKQIPEALIAIGSSAAGAVAALLARTSSGPESAPVAVPIPTQPVSVPASEPMAADDGHTLTDLELASIGANENEGAA